MNKCFTRNNKKTCCDKHEDKTNCWKTKIFFYYLTFRMFQHISLECFRMLSFGAGAFTEKGSRESHRNEYSIKRPYWEILVSFFFMQAPGAFHKLGLNTSCCSGKEPALLSRRDFSERNVDRTR